MVQTIALWAVKAAAPALVGAGVTGKALFYASAAIYGATAVGVTVGLAYASQALIDTPSPESAQGSMKQSIPPRIVAYGRGKLPGFYMLWEAQKSHAFDVVALHHGQAEAIEQVWSHDHRLQFVGGGASGWVQGGHGYGGGNSDLIHVQTRLGLPTETAYPAIVAALGGAGVWTDNHRGDGIASLGANYRHGKKENLLADYPNGDPSWSAVGRWKPIWDPRNDTTSASSNTGLQILDLLTSPDGLGQDYETTVAPLIDHWKAQLDICDEAIPQRGGGTAPRYESFVYRALSDDPVECLNKLLDACDGRLLMDENGCWKFWAGKYQPPTVFLTEEDIHGYEVAGDASTEDVVNELVPSFKSEEHGWNMVETDPWRDSADAGMRGRVETQPFALEAVNRNSQVRRLAKREMSRLLSSIRGTLQCKLSAARAMGERWVGVDFPELGFDNVVIEVEDGAVTSLQSLMVSVPFVLADPLADQWNAATEEGPGPEQGERLVQPDLEAPVITAVETFADSTGEGTGARLRITTTGPDREDLSWAARWRVTGSASWVEGTFVDIDPSSGVLLETGFVAAEDLDVQTAYTTGGGSLSPWSDTFVVDASIATPTPTATDLTGSVSGNDVTISWRYPQTPFGYLRLRQGASPDTGSDLPGDFTGALGAVDTVLVEDLEPNAWWFTVTAYSGSDVPSAPLGPMQVNVFVEPDTNLLDAPSDFSAASWEKGQNGTGSVPVVTANAGTAPDGTVTADRIQFTTAGTSGDASDHAFVRQLPAGAGANAHGSIWLKSNTGADQTVYLRCDGEQHAVTVKPYWQRLTPPDGTGTLSFWIGLRGSVTGSTATADVLAWGAHLALS